MLVIPWILLSLTGNDGNTILRKLLESREYAVKVLCLEISMMLVYAIAELFVEEAKAGKHEKIRSVLSKITDSKAWSVFRKYIGPMAVLALTVLVVCLNFSMMSDRVLWGMRRFLRIRPTRMWMAFCRYCITGTIIRHCIITG